MKQKVCLLLQLSDSETKPGHRCLLWIQGKSNIKFNKLQQEIGRFMIEAIFTLCFYFFKENIIFNHSEIN